MKGFKSKKGISLIVLVITIIVMIILAAAIILSLNNSGIIGKANKAKQDSDTANLKEYVNLLQAEWELMDTNERSSSGYASKEAYVNGKLAERGYSAAYSAEGEIYTVVNDVAKDALSKGLKIGDEVKYTVTANTYTSDSSKIGASIKLTAQTNLKWIYVGVSEKGELLITPDVSTGVPANSDVFFATAHGQAYLTGPDELNTICDKLYTTTKGTARSMDIDDVTRILGYTGEKGSYYDAELVYVPTTEAKKIGDIEKELSKTLSNRSTPEIGKNLEDYYSDYYKISKTDDVGKITYPENIKYVYPNSGKYFLASVCVKSCFARCSGYHSDPLCHFCVRFVDSSSVTSDQITDTVGNDTNWPTCSVRPIVSLSSKIQKNDDNHEVIWSFESID